MSKFNYMIWRVFLLVAVAAGIAVSTPELKAGPVSATPAATTQAAVPLVSATQMVAEVETCFSDWTEAGTLARANNLVSAKEVASLTRQRFDGRIVKMMLCSIEGRFIYRMFLENGGQVSTQVVDAAQPFAE